MTNKELTLKFYDALNEIFKINKHRTWADLSKEITIPKIAATYKFFGELFPYSLDRYNLLPKNDPTQKLTSIFHGTLDGLTIINNIARYSLYCDEIIVFHPLQNPVNTSPEYNPVAKPEDWRYEFVNALYFYIVLQKWVKAGIVHIIENPFHFNGKDRDFFWNEAKKRVDEKEELLRTPEVMEEHDEMLKQKMKLTMLGMPAHALEKTFRQVYPTYNDEQIKKLVEELKLYEKSLPLYVDFGKEVKPGGLTINRSGGNIEMIDALCRLTGAHSYTTQKFIKKQLELRGTNPFWTKFGVLYSGLNLTYLDNVDTAFALMIREEERISGLRKALRELSAFLEQTELTNLPDDKVLFFNDKMNTEIKKSEEEWLKIINDAKRANVAAIAGTNAISLFIDPTKFIIPALSIPSSIAITEFFKKRGLKNYRVKDPYSVFVDLKNKKPSFFSDLKNCIF